MKPTPLIPVHRAQGCAGHPIRSARGFRAFDTLDREIGAFVSTEAASAARKEVNNAR